jgi:hypothetical protein
MHRVIVLLEGEPLSQSQISGRLKQVSLEIFLVVSAIIPSNLTHFPVLADKKHGVLRVMRGVGFVPDIAFSLMAK